MPWLLERGRAGWTPMISIRIDGNEVAAGFYGRLIEATTRDEPGQNADTCTFTLDDARNELFAPRERAHIEVWLGYRESGIYRIGEYEMQAIEFAGGADGETMVIQGKAADLRRIYKGDKRRSWEGKTFGDVVKDIARDNGVEALVSPELASLQIPYVLQVDHSDIDFLTRLGDEHDAVVKPSGGKLVVVPRAAGLSATGQPLPEFSFDRGDCVSWSVTPHGRPAYGKVSSAWVDQQTGKRRVEQYETGLDGPELVLPEAQPDRERAKREARAEGRRLTSDTAAGRFEMYGRPDAQADAPVRPTGFRDGCLGPWIAQAVEHKVGDGGFLTTVSVKAPPAPKKTSQSGSGAASAQGGGASDQGSGSSLWFPTGGAWPSDGR